MPTLPMTAEGAMLWAAAVSAFLAAYLAILALTERSESLEKRINRLTALHPGNPKVADGKDIRALLTRLAKHTPKSWSEKLNHELLSGDIELTGGEFIVLQVFLALLFLIVGFLLTRSLILALIFLGFGGIALPNFYLKRAQTKKIKKFNNQLGDSLLILANSLRAGFSLLQSMEMVSQEMPNPISGEFKITLREMTYGTSTETAMLNLASRVKSEDLDLLVTAILIQRQVGGNLAEVLTNIHATIEDRLRIQGEIKSLTAQGRMSGYIIGALPIFIATAVSIMNPSYMKLLFTTTIGLILLAIGVSSQLIGFLIIRKIIDIKA